MVKNVVQTGFQVANKVQENLSASNIWDKVISFIPECVNKISTTLNKKKVAAIMGMQNPEPYTSTGVQTSRKSTSLIPKRKTTITSKTLTLPKSQASKKNSNSPPTPPPRGSSTTTTAQIHMPPMTTRSGPKKMHIHHFQPKPLLMGLCRIMSNKNPNLLKRQWEKCLLKLKVLLLV